MRTALAIAALWTVIAFAPVLLLIAVREWDRIKGGGYLPDGVQPVKHPASLPPIPEWANEPACPDYIPRSWTA